MKKSLLLLLAVMLLMMFAFAACNKTEDPVVPPVDPGTEDPVEPVEEPLEARTIQVGWGMAATGSAHALYFEGMSQNLAEITDGVMTMEGFGAGALGGEKDMAESMQMGSLDSAEIGTGILTYWDNTLVWVETPGFMKSYQMAYALYDSEYWAESWEKIGPPNGWHHLHTTDIGVREWVTNIDISKPENLKGKNIRVYESLPVVTYYTVMGVNPTNIVFAEIFTALQTGALDTLELPILTLYSSRFQEATKYWYRVPMITTTMYYAWSDALWNELSPAQQEMVNAASLYGQQYCRDKIFDLEAEYLTAMHEAGTDIRYDPTGTWLQNHWTYAEENIYPEMMKQGVFTQENLDMLNELDPGVGMFDGRLTEFK